MPRLNESIQHILDGMDLIPTCVDSQVLAGVPLDIASDRVFQSFRERLRPLSRISLEEEMSLIGAIGKVAQWSATQKQELIQMIADNNVRSKVPGKGGRSKLQACMSFENLIPDALWVTLKEEGRTDVASATMVCQLASSLGIINASEKTLNRMISIVGFCQRYQRMPQCVVSILKAHMQDNLHVLGKLLPKDYPYLLAYWVHIICALTTIDRCAVTRLVIS